MRFIIPVAALLVAGIAPAATPELTADQVRAILASSGFNAGTSRAVGDLGVYTLQSVYVRQGRSAGEFIITVKITHGR